AFCCNFVLPSAAGAGGFYVRSRPPDSALPSPGVRVDPSYAPQMPKIVVGAVYRGAIVTVPGAHHFRFIGIEVAPTPGTVVNLNSLIELRSGETDATAGPHDVIFDRCDI